MYTVYFKRIGEDSDVWDEDKVIVKAFSFQEAFEKAKDKYPERHIRGIYEFDEEIIE